VIVWVLDEPSLRHCSVLAKALVECGWCWMECRGYLGKDQTTSFTLGVQEYACPGPKTQFNRNQYMHTHKLTSGFGSTSNFC